MKSTRAMGPCLIVLLLAGCTREPAVSEKETEKQPQAEPPSRAVDPVQPAPDSGEPPRIANEWPAWRGPQGNGFSPEVPHRLPPKKVLWSREMAGECHAPISVGGGRVLVADHGNERDYWRCFDAVDGTPVWTYEYANAEKMEFGAAPRTAPLIHRGKAYCLNAWGELFCLELASGNVAWKKHLAREFQQKTPTWGYTCSPLLADGKLIVNPGGSGGPVAALDLETGNVVWTGEGEALNYSSFIVGTFGDVEQVVGYDKQTIGGWDVKTGRRLWTFEVDSSYGYIAPTPVAVAGRLLLTSDQEDARLIGFGPSGKIAQEPEGFNEDVAPEMSTPTLWGDVILAASNGLILLDPSPLDGGDPLKTLWIYDAEDTVNSLCHVIASEDRALVMCEDGQLLLLAADRQSCQILDRLKLCDKTWVHPALAGGRLYARDKAMLYCYDMPPSHPQKGDQ